ncbi:MAG: class I SAM-dependent methyltransferase [Chloroflexi bacterium]|nr:class I SAM-dependent methyltransferase [Chloroflexota bacterium]
MFRNHVFYTPGVEEALAMFVQHARPGAGSRLLDVGCGTGEGLMRLAEAHGCHGLGVDVHGSLAAARANATRRGVGSLLAFVRGDGGALPLRDAAFDGVTCFGAPSIVGTERCLDEVGRVVRRGGVIAVSDWTWRAVPPPPDAIPGHFDAPLLTTTQYAAVVQSAGFELIAAEELPEAAWDAYYAPTLPILDQMRAEGEPDNPLTDEVRIWREGTGREWWRYAVFVARRT